MRIAATLQRDALDAGAKLFVIVRLRDRIISRRNVVGRSMATQMDGVRDLLLVQAADRINDPALDLLRGNSRNRSRVGFVAAQDRLRDAPSRLSSLP